MAVDAHFPLARMDSPESQGLDRKFRLTTGVSQMHELQVVDNAGDRPVSTDSAYLSTVKSAMALGAYGLSENFDVGFRFTLGKAPVMVSAKMQLLGQPASIAEAGNLSLALTAGIGYWDEKKNGTQNQFGGRADYPWDLSLTSRNYDLGAIVGYRPFDRILVFGGPFYTYYDVNIVLAHAQSSASAKHDYVFEYDGHQLGMNVGASAEMTDAIDLMCEALISQIQIKDLKNTALSGSAAISFRF